VVYPTGREVAAGQIRDTNTPFLMKALESEGYEVLKGPILDDDAVAISRAFRDAAAEGYGLLITTGGIGAERKDLTIQALTAVDLGALIPYILKFRRGQGRHHRDGVRIGVGRLHRTTIVCLPGPHDEVELAWPILRQGLQESWDTKALAEGLARVLREKFLARSRPEHGGHGHSEEVDHGIE
jgi:molybdenum cofactor synthesis domain-containing protein